MAAKFQYSLIGENPALHIVATSTLFGVIRHSGTVASRADGGWRMTVPGLGRWDQVADVAGQAHKRALARTSGHIDDAGRTVEAALSWLVERDEAVQTASASEETREDAARATDRESIRRYIRANTR